jgi:endonuclease YncB( thermonuclease family)
MFERIKGWIWKRPIGFDWHQYVQTTIKLKRQQRRQRVVDAGQAAVDQAQAAAGKVAAGSLAAGAAAKDGAKAAANTAGQIAVSSIQQTPAALAWLLGPVAALAARVTRPLYAILARPAVAGPLVVAGLIAVISGLARWSAGSLHEAWMPLGIGAALLAAGLPALAGQMGFNPGRTFRFKMPPGPPVPALNVRSGLALAGAALLVGGLGYVATRSGAPLTSLATTATSPSLTAKPTIEARQMQALSGDTIRLDGRTVRLSGIEAPDRQQVCTQGASKRWKCGETAQVALERLGRGKSVRCVVASTEPSGRSLATCTVDGRDLAADLLKDGHVFSSSGYFGAYASLESEAKRNKAGLWAGEAERPADYRTRLWEAAAKSAPDGCPIKAHVTQGGKVYVLPWASDYARVTIRATRGDRWFCSEQDAAAAGFKLGGKG